VCTNEYKEREKVASEWSIQNVAHESWIMHVAFGVCRAAV